MALHVFDPVAFRLQFPAFSDPVVYTNVQLGVYFTMATEYMTAWDSRCGGLSGARLQTALNMMTAHLAATFILPAGVKPVVGLETSASIDKVSVSVKVPDTRSGWQFWLSTTPYGLMLWAFLSARAAGGAYIGGSPERSAFRKVGGRF